jgi:hypothetical protein
MSLCVVVSLNQKRKLTTRVDKLKPRAASAHGSEYEYGVQSALSGGARTSVMVTEWLSCQRNKLSTLRVVL